ncbi:MAG: nitroreductase family protein [Sneathiella sp.]|nr:nitroreductase family protein [Sneathiella sp.]
MPQSDLLTILEAARWAPSAFNIQPWRFLFSHRGDDHWDTYLNLLDSFNASWAQNASALVIVLSDTLMPGDGDRPDKPSRYNTFDSGAAWAQIALQTTMLGYQAHATAGLDLKRAQESLIVPERYRIEIAIAIGKRADPSMLPQELQEREQPSQRLPMNEIAFSGAFPQ